MEWLIINKTHLYALFVITGHDSDTLMSDTDVGGDAIFYHTITSFNNLEENDNIIISKVYPKTVNQIWYKSLKLQYSKATLIFIS